MTSDGVGGYVTGRDINKMETEKKRLLSDVKKRTTTSEHVIFVDIEYNNTRVLMLVVFGVWRC